jgi:hypothetical protein
VLLIHKYLTAYERSLLDVIQYTVSHTNLPTFVQWRPKFLFFCFLFSIPLQRHTCVRRMHGPSTDTKSSKLLCRSHSNVQASQQPTQYYSEAFIHSLLPPPSKHKQESSKPVAHIDEYVLDGRGRASQSPHRLPMPPNSPTPTSPSPSDFQTHHLHRPPPPRKEKEKTYCKRNPRAPSSLTF